MHSPWLARPAQYVMGLVGLRGLSPLPGPPSVLWGPGACLRCLGSPLCCGARVYLLWLPGPPSVSRGLCTLSLSPRAHPGLTCPKKHGVPAPLPLKISGTLTRQPFSKGIPRLGPLSFSPNLYSIISLPEREPVTYGHCH